MRVYRPLVVLGMLGVLSAGCSSEEVPATASAAEGAASGVTAEPTDESGGPTDEAVETSDKSVEVGEAEETGAADDGDLGTPAATRQATKENVAYTLAVYPLVRDGQLATLTYRLTVDALPEGKDNVFPHTLVGTNSWNDGTTLVDSTNNKVYLPARDVEGDCLCSDVNRVMLAGETQTMTAVYAAPPEDISSVDLIVPTFGSVPGVPVE